MSHRNDDDSVYEMLGAAAALEHGPTQIAMLEEAVRRADMQGDLDLQFEARRALVEAGIFGGRSDLAMVAFTWRIAQHDAHPQRFDEFQLLWEYKWVVNVLAEYPQLSRAQIQAAIDDLLARFVRGNHSLHAVEKIRWQVALDMGDLQIAQSAYQAMLQTRRDALSDCAACVQNGMVQFHESQHDYEHAIEIAAPILRGSMRCSEVPHRTYAHLLRPLFELNRIDEAMEHHRQGYRLTQRGASFVSSFGEHMEFLALTDNLTSALNMLARHLAQALAAPAKIRTLHYLRAALFVLRAAAAKGKKNVKLRLDPAIPFARADGHYAVDELLTAIAAEAEELTRQFDERNGNAYFRGRLDEIDAMLAAIRPHPLPQRQRKPRDAD